MAELASGPLTFGTYEEALLHSLLDGNQETGAGARR